MAYVGHKFEYARHTQQLLHSLTFVFWAIFGLQVSFRNWDTIGILVPLSLGLGFGPSKKKGKMVFCPGYWTSNLDS